MPIMIFSPVSNFGDQSLVQKEYEWPLTRQLFCQNDCPLGGRGEDHFGKRTAWSPIYFLNYAYLEIWPSVLFFYSPSNNSFWKNFTLCYLTIIIRFEILKAFIFFNCRYNFFCDTCGKQFCRPFELRRHMAVKHGEGEMPYPCDQCEKKFFEPKELRSHIAITHQGELNSEYQRVK